MALKHVVTAIKAQGKGEDMVISLMTKSPRGTQVPFKSVEVKRGQTSRAAFKADMASAIEILLDGELAPIQ